MNLNELETREVSSRKLVTGFAPIQIIAVNPDVKKLREILNTDDVKEPNYEAERGTRLDFWFVSHPMSKIEFKGRFAMWASSDVRISKSEKQHIDNYTKTMWAMNLANASEIMANIKDDRRLDMKSIREAKEGEENVYNLMKGMLMQVQRLNHLCLMIGTLLLKVMVLNYKHFLTTSINLTEVLRY